MDCQHPIFYLRSDFAFNVKIEEIVISKILIFPKQHNILNNIQAEYLSFLKSFLLRKAILWICEFCKKHIQFDIYRK